MTGDRDCVEIQFSFQIRIRLIASFQFIDNERDVVRAVHEILAVRRDLHSSNEFLSVGASRRLPYRTIAADMLRKDAEVSVLRPVLAQVFGCVAASTESVRENHDWIWWRGIWRQIDLDGDLTMPAVVGPCFVDRVIVCRA